MVGNSKSKFWIFTWNNPPNPRDGNYFKERKLEGIQYISWQLEIAPTTGTLHWQGFIEFKGTRSIAYFKKFLPAVHAEIMFSNREACRQYTREEYKVHKETGEAVQRLAGPWEFGEFFATETKVNVGNQVAQMISEGKSFQDVAAEFPGFCLLHDQMISRAVARYEAEHKYPALDDYLENTWEMFLPILQDKKRHYWIWSTNPSVGKTTNANNWLEKFGGLEYSYAEHFQEVSKQRLVILDAYNTPYLRYSQLEQMCDGNYKYPVKNGLPFKIKNPVVIILCNKSMQSHYPKGFEVLSARFIEIKINGDCQVPKGIEKIIELTGGEEFEEIEAIDETAEELAAMEIAKEVCV